MNPSIDDIINTVCEHFGLTEQEYYSDRRPPILDLARRIGCWLCRDITDLSLPEISKKVHRDKSNIAKLVRQVDRDRAEDPELQDILDWVSAKVFDLPITVERLVQHLHHVDPDTQMQILEDAAEATGGHWNPPRPMYGDHEFSIKVMGILATGVDGPDVCQAWLKCALRTLNTQEAA